MAKQGWHSVSRLNRCHVCDGCDNCTVSEDGRAAWCGRVEKGSIRQNAGGQWLHILKDRGPAKPYEHPSHRRARQLNKQRPARPDVNWPQLMEFCTNRDDIAEKRGILAQQLGVSVSSLGRIGVGWSDRHSAWLIPERDGTGRIIGVVRRYPNGNKRQMSGGKRGLTFDPDWQSAPGPVLLTEGASDVAAILSAGACAVGRPSNSGGVNHLCELLCRLPLDREVICLGENDRKPHDSLKPAVRARHSLKCEGCLTCWPGHAAFNVAEQLAESLQRPVSVAFPPDDVKDVRELLLTLEGAS